MKHTWGPKMSLRYSEKCGLKKLNYQHLNFHEVKLGLLLLLYFGSDQKPLYVVCHLRVEEKVLVIYYISIGMI